MSGFCDFCQMWHSGSCCHPGRAKLAELERQNAELRTALQEMQLQFERMDSDAIVLEGGDGFIRGYEFKTGAWHTMLGMIRGGIVSQALATPDRAPRACG